MQSHSKNSVRFSGPKAFGRIVLLLAPILGIPPALAQARSPPSPVPDKALCLSKNDVTTEKRIVACTAILESTRTTTKQKVSAYYVRGNAHIDRNDVDSAIGDFDKAIWLAPLFGLAYRSRGGLFARKNNYDRAIADFNECIRLQPNGSAYIDRGAAYLGKGDIDRAIADFNTMIERHPKEAIGFTNRGEAYRRKGDLMRAIADLSRAIELDPKDSLSFYDRGIAYSDQGEADRAIADYDEAIRLKPDDAMYYNNRGNARISKKDSIGAIVDYDQAIKLDPEFALAYYNRGTAYSNQNVEDKALADFDASNSARSELCRSLWQPCTPLQRSGRYRPRLRRSRPVAAARPRWLPRRLRARQYAFGPEKSCAGVGGFQPGHQVQSQICRRPQRPLPDADDHGATAGRSCRL